LIFLWATNFNRFVQFHLVVLKLQECRRLEDTLLEIGPAHPGMTLEVFTKIADPMSGAILK
jgi:hypothetical protein